MLYKRVKIPPNWADIFGVSIFFAFACGSTTSGGMAKWMTQADSVHQIGPETTLQGILIVVESGGTGG